MQDLPFHPAVKNWFNKTFTAATPAQVDAWPAIKKQQHTLIAAPTGSGKTLAAFLASLDNLVEEGLQQGLKDQTYVVYISPLKALSNDIQKNLQAPLCGIADALNELALPNVDIRAWVRTGDTPASERERMRKTPPHILVTTPESLYILLTSESGRSMLQTTSTVIIDEIHALADNKRGSHLALSLQRLEALTPKPLIRIGMSATQKPIETVAHFLTGSTTTPCNIVDSGHHRQRDLAIVVPGSPLEAVMSNEVWQEIYKQLTELIEEHRTTLIFVNTRRLAERAARALAEHLGEDKVAAHHGSLAREHRLEAEQKLKHGELSVMVATASLELGIDIGDVDLVCQLGSPKRIATLLQRVGRSGHAINGTPKGRIFPLTRDELVECTALLNAIQQNQLDTLTIPPGPIDVLAQHIVAEVASREWHEDELYQYIKQAYPYQNLQRDTFTTIINMLAEGFSTHRGRRGAYIHYDAVNKQLRPRKSARLTAITNAGAIPDHFDYDVVLEPSGQFIGTLNEDFAFESLPGDIFQLGNTSYRILKIEQGKVRVEDAHGQPPNIPFWFGESPGRSDELSDAVSHLSKTINEHLNTLSIDETIAWVVKNIKLSGQAAVQLVEYLAAARAALKQIPTKENIIIERFFDEAGDQHIVIHSPYGSRLNRAWGLALRKRFCRKFNFELQAAALEDSIVLSLGATHSFPLDEVSHYLHSNTVRDVLTQAMLDAPVFMTHWRWNTNIALAVQRNRAGKRVPAQFQRMDAEDLISVIFPDQLACQENIQGEREIPDHPLINQTIYDCLHDVMDIEGLETLLKNLEAKHIQIQSYDLAGPSPLAQEILTARPYAFLDDAPAEERRTQAVAARRFMDPESASDLGRLDPDAIQQVCEEAWPNITNADELHDALMILSFIDANEIETLENNLIDMNNYMQQLIKEKRACYLKQKDKTYWVCAERLTLLQSIFTDAKITPAITAINLKQQSWSRETAIHEILRSRLEGLGPVNEQTLANSLNCTIEETHTALLALEEQGNIMQGHFTAEATANPQQASLEWCERGLLARIHRYTMRELRKAVQPVSSATYMQFLFQWHGIGNERAEGENAILSAIQKLEGFNIPASAWETDILPNRVHMYLPHSLDKLCSAGHIIWARLQTRNNKNKTSQTPVKNTSISLCERQHHIHWAYLLQTKTTNPISLSSNAEKIHDLLKQRGALFFIDLVQQSGLLRTQVETLLAELVANGLVTSDGFAGLRALITPNNKRQSYARRRSRIPSNVNNMDDAGRWTLIQMPGNTQNTKNWLTTPMEILDYIAMTLLRRYGVVFRKVLERESNLPPWRELLYAFRRMEARGDIRGGRFIDGFGGEQFALPEAVGLLRKKHKQTDSGEMIAISATDPLNLTGIMTPSERVAALTTNRILYKDGIPIAKQINNKTEFIHKLAAETEWNARNMLIKQHNPSSFFRGPTHKA